MTNWDTIYDYLYWNKLNHYGAVEGLGVDNKQEASEIYDALHTAGISDLNIYEMKFLGLRMKELVESEELIDLLLETIKFIEQKKDGEPA